jgi:hypothetical protein
VAGGSCTPGSLRTRRVQPLRRRLDGPAPRERPGAKALIEQATEQQRIGRGVLTVHARPRRADARQAGRVLAADLGITKTHIRPCTSSDNPYSESQFKTLKYRPGDDDAVEPPDGATA